MDRTTIKNMACMALNATDFIHFLRLINMLKDNDDYFWAKMESAMDETEENIPIGLYTDENDAGAIVELLQLLDGAIIQIKDEINKTFQLQEPPKEPVLAYYCQFSKIKED